MEKLKELLAKTKCSITLTINNHRDYYETVEEYLKDFPNSDFMDEVENEVYNKMVELNTIIELQVYPNNPIGFYKLYHYDLDMILDIALKD